MNAILAAILVFSVPQLAIADYSAWCREFPVAGRKPVCRNDDAKACVVPLCRGEAAPFDGQISTPEQAARGVAELGACTKAWSDCESSIDRRLELARVADQAKIEAQAFEIDALKRANQAAIELDRPFWQQPAYVWTVTAVAVVGLGVSAKLAFSK